MNLLDKIKDLYDQVLAGKGIEGFDKYYHDDIVKIEATGQTRKGKDLNRLYEERYYEGIETIHGGAVTAMASNEEDGVTFIEAWMEVTFADGRKVTVEEVARQVWKDDKIIEERFYYNPG